MAKMKPYKYQAKIIKQVGKKFKKGIKKLIVQLGTGGGKTVIFSFIASRVSKRNNKVLIITDRMELLSQAGGTIKKFDMNPFYIKAGTTFIDKSKTVYVGMAQTLRNRISKPVWRDFIQKEISLIIIDEAHVQEFNYLFKDDFLKDKYVLGFTATPARTGKMTQLGIQYEQIVYGASIKSLIKKGYLVNCDIFDFEMADMSKVSFNHAKGDYSESSMYKAYNQTKLYSGLVKNYKDLVDGQKMIVFCCNVEHAIRTTIKLQKAGISSKFVCSKKTPPKEPRKWTQAKEEIYKEKFRAWKLYNKYFHRYSGDRKKIFAEFGSGEFEVLVNVDIATKGFDDPAITVVALLRATVSLTLYLQMIGRGSRISPSTGKTHFTVLDFGGNKERFGGYDVDRNWSLWHEESKSEGGVPPMKICGLTAQMEPIEGAAGIKEGCERMILASYKLCPFCGFKYPVRTKEQEIELQLSKVTDKHGVSIKTKKFSEMTFEELTKYREIKKHHLNWLYRMLWLRDKESTIKAYANQYNWKSGRLWKVLRDCENKF